MGCVNKAFEKEIFDNAVHCDIVVDYSLQEIVKMMRKFGAL